MKAKPILLPAFAAAAVALFATVTALADHHLVGTGSFSGKSDHVTSGSVAIEKSGEGFVLKLGDDFNFDGAPDPKLAFGKDGYQKATLFSKLQKNKGAQTYPLPADYNPADYNEVWLWCQKFDVPLGLAKLTK
jgi:hypothetical protein